MNNITPTYNGAIPNFPQALAVNIDYTDTPILIDLLTNLFQGKINGVQTVFIDLINSDSDIELIMLDTKQRIVAKAGTMGYYPILSSQLMKFETKAYSPQKYNIIFINFPIAAGVWGFNVIKGDKGEKGEKGASFLISNSPSPIGESIFNISYDQNTNEEIATFSKLIAGDGIDIINHGDLLEIVNLGGGQSSQQSEYNTTLDSLQAVALNDINSSADSVFELSNSYILKNPRFESAVEFYSNILSLKSGGIYDINAVSNTPSNFPVNSELTFLITNNDNLNEQKFKVMTDEYGNFNFNFKLITPYSPLDELNSFEFKVFSNNNVILSGAIIDLFITSVYSIISNDSELEG